MSKSNDDSVFEAMFGLAMVAGWPFFRTMALTHLWRWFVLPVSDLPLDYWQLFGISLTVRVLLHSTSILKKDSSGSYSLAVTMTVHYVVVGIMLFVGWLVAH